MVSRKGRRAARSLDRKVATRKPATVHWVFCEGKTEKDCIDRLRQRYRLPSVRVEVVGQVGEPKKVVQEAAKKKKEMSGSKHLPTVIHVVFDRDEHKYFDSAIDRARALKLSIGVSVPCIELWAVLLHQDQTAPIHRHDVQKLLKQIHPNYCHDTNPLLDPAVVADNRKYAATRAHSLARRALYAEKEFSNPSTTFSLVLNAIFGEEEPPT